MSKTAPGRAVLYAAACFLFIRGSVVAGGDDFSYRFSPGSTLTYSLVLSTKIHPDPERLENFISLGSRHELVFYITGVAPAGEVTIAATSRLMDAEVLPGESGVGRQDRNRLRDWVRDFSVVDSAAFILDPWGKILRGRMVWPETSCYHLPKILEGLTIRPGRDTFPGGKFRISPVASGMEMRNGKSCLVFTSRNSSLNLKLWVEEERGIPAALEAEYGYQTFQSIFEEKLSLSLEDAPDPIRAASPARDPALAAAVIQAALLEGNSTPDPDAVAAALASDIPRLRKIGAAALARTGIPGAVDISRVRQDPEDAVRFNAAKAEFLFLNRKDGLAGFQKSGPAEFRERAGRLLEARSADSGHDEKLLAGLKEGALPAAGLAEKDIYAAARRSLEARQAGPVHFGPKSFTLRSGVWGTRLFHYGVYLPEDYDPAERWPVLINLTGGNGFAESNFLATSKTLPDNYVLVSPDADDGLWWEPDQARMLDDLFEIVLAGFSADRDRVYIQGFSNGGIGTYTFAYRHADSLAAAASLEGYSRPAGGKTGVETEMSLNLKNTPILIIHGDRDMTISVVPDRTLAEFLAANKIPHRFLEVAGEGHSVTFQTYGKEVMGFFRKARRNPAPERVRLVVDDPADNRSFWVRVEEKEDAGSRAFLEAESDKGLFRLESRNVKSLSLLLSDRHYIPDQAYEVLVNGREMFRGELRLDPAVLSESLARESDPEMLYGVKLTLNIRETYSPNP